MLAGVCPVLFAGVIFASSFKRTNEPDRLSVQYAGAMLGGLAEYSSMLLGLSVSGAGGNFVLRAFGSGPDDQGTRPGR